MGALFSLLLVVNVLIFAGYKIYILEGKKSIDIVQAVLEDHFDSDFVYSAEEGFNFALAVFNPFDLTTLQSLDPSFGRIRF